MQAFAERLRQRRKELNLSQNDLAKMVDSYSGQISRYESDEVEPSIGIVAKLAQALGVSVDWLLGVDHPPEPIKFADLEEIEQQLVNLYRAKTPESQKRLLEVAKLA